MNLSTSDTLTLIGIIVGLCVYIHQNLKSDLNDPKVRAELARRLREQDFEQQYREFLAWGLQRLDRLFGDKLLGLRAYGVCLSLAVIYSTALFLIGWAIGGPGGIGSLQTLPEDWPLWMRGLGLAVMLVSAGLIVWVFRSCDRWVALAEDFLLRCGVAAGRAEGWLRILGAVMVGASYWWQIGSLRLMGLMFAFVIIYGSSLVPLGLLGFAMVGFLNATSLGSLGLPAFTLGVGLWFISSMGIELAGASVVMLALCIGVGFNWFSGNFRAEAAANFILFWAFLPLANALLDWLSWAISRALGREILQDRRWVTVLRHGVLDGVAAVVLLVLLAILLVAGVEAVDLWIAHQTGKTPVDAAKLLDAARADPFGPNGLWITAMLVGTLIPTLLHVFSLCLALLLRLVPGFLRRWMLAKLDAPAPRMDELTWLALLRMVAWPVSALVVILLVGLLLDAVAYAAAPTSELLYGLAQWTIGSLREAYGT